MKKNCFSKSVHALISFVIIFFIYGVNYSSAQILDQPVSKSNFVLSSAVKGGSEEEKVKKIKEREDQRHKNNLESNKVTENNKPHYILNLNTSAANKQQAYIYALTQFARIEQFRFVEKRRTINLQGGDGSITLFSSQELFDLYGKRIRPQNIKQGQSYLEVEFLLGDSGLIKEQLIR
jgi:hypothetical protein